MILIEWSIVSEEIYEETVSTEQFEGDNERETDMNRDHYLSLLLALLTKPKREGNGLKSLSLRDWMKR